MKSQTADDQLSLYIWKAKMNFHHTDNDNMLIRSVNLHNAPDWPNINLETMSLLTEHLRSNIIWRPA